MMASPLVLQSTVVKGFGRGSRQLGVPTANMDPGPLLEQLQQLRAEGASSREAARQLAERSGHSRRALYALLHRDGPGPA